MTAKKTTPHRRPHRPDEHHPGGLMTATVRRRRLVRPLPGIACEIRDESWGPHPGCAEFMSRPEVWTCKTPATHHAHQVDDSEAAYYEPNHAAPVKVRLCAAHAARAGHYGLTRPYRFRRI